MLRENTLSVTSDLISAVWTADGELTKLDKKKLKYLKVSPLSSSQCEVGFRGSVSDGLFERIKESLSKLPSLHDAQLKPLGLGK